MKARKPGFASWLNVRAAAVAVMTAARIGLQMRRTPLDDIVRSASVRRELSGRLRDPALHARVVNRLLPYLPPRRMGPCIKRSLLLFHLWSRCGLKPHLHLGYLVSGAGTREGHAWLTVEEPPLAASRPTGSYVETYVFEAV